MLKFASHFSKLQNYKIIYIKSVFGFIRKAKYSLREYCHINHKSFRACSSYIKIIVVFETTLARFLQQICTE